MKEKVVSLDKAGHLAVPWKDSAEPSTDGSLYQGGYSAYDRARPLAYTRPCTVLPTHTEGYGGVFGLSVPDFPLPYPQEPPYVPTVCLP